MSMTIADITFDRVEYDSDADVLYLHVGDPSTAVDFDKTPEGHAVRFDATGNLGITLVRPKHLLDQSGGLRITLPVPSEVSARELTPAGPERLTAGSRRAPQATPGASAGGFCLDENAAS
jgi:uncharacterized protein YuzE